MSPNFKDTQQIINDFRSSNTTRAKQKVVKGIKKRFPQIADRLSKLLDEGKEGSR